jgi:hypothetical protein
LGVDVIERHLAGGVEVHRKDLLRQGTWMIPTTLAQPGC